MCHIVGLYTVMQIKLTSHVTGYSQSQWPIHVAACQSMAERP